MEHHEDKQGEVQGLGWRVSLSILVGVGWLVFLIIWLFFYAGALHSVNKNFAIVLTSILVITLLLGIPWAWWGLRYRSEREKEMWKLKGFRLRLWVSLILFFLVILFLIVWFYLYADSFTLYQNIAIFLVSLLIPGGILAAMWAPWGMKYGSQTAKQKQEQE